MIRLSESSQSEKAPTARVQPWRNDRDRRREDCLPGGGMGGQRGRARRVFRALKHSKMRLWWVRVIHHVSKPIEWTTPGVIPKVSHGLREATCPGELISCNRCATPAGVDSGGWVCVGAGLVGNLSLPCNLEPETALTK